VAIIRFKSRWLLPPLAVVTSPQGIRDVLGGSDGSVDKADKVHAETRAWGNNLFNLPHAKWTNRRRVIQPLFAKKHVASFADHIGAAADALTDSWLKQGSIDVDREIRQTHSAGARPIDLRHRSRQSCRRPGNPAGKRPTLGVRAHITTCAGAGMAADTTTAQIAGGAEGGSHSHRGSDRFRTGRP
jgi:hypothetical protein